MFTSIRKVTVGDKGEKDPEESTLFGKNNSRRGYSKTKLIYILVHMHSHFFPYFIGGA
jgi:hypothetical protein